MPWRGRGQASAMTRKGRDREKRGISQQGRGTGRRRCDTPWHGRARAEKGDLSWHRGSVGLRRLDLPWHGKGAAPRRGYLPWHGRGVGLRRRIYHGMAGVRTGEGCISHAIEEARALGGVSPMTREGRGPEKSDSPWHGDGRA